MLIEARERVVFVIAGALTGAAAGGLVALLWTGTGLRDDLPPMANAATGMGAAIGALLPRRTGARGIAFVVASVLAGGFLAGAMVGCAVDTARPVLVTGVFALSGAAHALFFVPAFLLLHATLAIAGRLRSRSTARQLASRWLWRWTALSLYVVLFVAAAFSPQPGPVRPPSEAHFIGALPLMAAALLLIAAALDVASLIRFRGILRLLPAMQRRDMGSGPCAPDSAMKVIDLGTGAIEFEMARPGATPYRDGQRLLLLVRGDPRRLQRALRGMLVIDAILLLMAASLGVAMM